jgi:hypothetical protein
LGNQKRRKFNIIMSNQTESDPSHPQQNGQKRPRIQPKVLQQIAPDPLEYVANKSTNRARKIISISEKLDIDIWFDKHYVDRSQHGDENGLRDGIDQTIVRRLVAKSMPHLLFYGATVQLFTFLNIAHDKTKRALRVVVQEQSDNSILSVVIEVHFVKMNYFEITVKTAICKQDFELSDGQYAVHIDGKTSVLRKREKGKDLDIYSIV